MKTVPCVSDVTMRVNARLIHLCPFKDEVDNGHVVVTWRVNGQTLELHALAQYLNAWAAVTISHEEITDRIRHDLATVDGLTDVSVETFWDTAGMDVTCSTSPTLAVTP